MDNSDLIELVGRWIILVMGWDDAVVEDFFASAKAVAETVNRRLKSQQDWTSIFML